MTKILKGRGAQINPPDPFAKTFRIDSSLSQDEIKEQTYLQSSYIEVYPKSIVNKVDSPDVGMDYSINPYQGCEHGCVYCYARNTHPYWGYSAGMDFERKIMVKIKAPDLLRDFLMKKSWKGTPIVLSGNTDCYQPIERKLNITRKLLKTFREFNHSTGIITKNSLIQRDLDVLSDLNSDQLVHVILSITTLDESLRRELEPRTATIKQRLETVAMLAREGIPVGVMVAPIIPGLNDHEIMEIIRIASLMGATKAGYTVVRLNGDIEEIFSDWIKKSRPDSADKILNRISDCHGGKASDSRFKIRMKGQGHFAKIIGEQFRIAVKKHMGENSLPPLNTQLYMRRRNPQLKLEL